MALELRDAAAKCAANFGWRDEKGLRRKSRTDKAGASAWHIRRLMSSPKLLSSIGVRRVNGIVGNTLNGLSEDAPYFVWMRRTFGSISVEGVRPPKCCRWRSVIFCFESFSTAVRFCAVDAAAFLLPRGEKDRMRGFGRWSFILNLPNPLTPSLSPLGRGRRKRRAANLSCPPKRANADDESAVARLTLVSGISKLIGWWIFRRRCLRSEAAASG